MNGRKVDKVSNATGWFADGLRFECRQCGACCTGEPGYIWLTPSEIRALAEVLHMECAAFCKTYLRSVNGKLSLKEKRNGDCILFNGNEKQCLVYEKRPTQCRTYPFWPEILHSPKTWERESRQCPGINTGRLYTAEQCASLLLESRVAEDCTATTDVQERT